MSEQPNKKGWGDRNEEQSRLPIFESDPGQSNEEQTAPATQSEQEDFKGMLNKVWDRLFKNKASAWTAVFTCALVIFSGLLWKVTDDSNKTSTATQRAFITFTTLYMEPVINNGIVPSGPHPAFTGYRFHLPMLNSGTTPTKYSTYELAAAAQDISPNEGTDFDSLPQTERYPFIFGPHQAYDGLGTEPISLADMESIREKGRHVFVWGWVVYRDVFDDSPIHLSEFCFNESNPRWTKPNHSDVTGNTLITTLPCQTHNCYDKDCKDYERRVQGFQ